MRSQLLVVGIEELFKSGVEGPVTGNAAQDERLEEPSSVRQMPLGRAGIRHGLQHLVFGGEWPGQFQRGLANLLVAASKRTAARGWRASHSPKSKDKFWPGRDTATTVLSMDARVRAIVSLFRPRDQMRLIA